MDETRTSVSKQLINKIEAGVWKPGERLPSERQLADLLTVSRGSVREALQLLSAMGRVEISPARGTYVTIPDTGHLSGALSSVLAFHGATVRDVFDARKMLEQATIQGAAHNITAESLHLLGDLAEQVDARTGQPLAQALADLKFHLLIAHSCGNPVLAAMYEAIMPQVLAMTLRPVRGHRHNDATHVALTAAIANGDAACVAELITIHLETTKPFFGDDFDRPLHEAAARNLDIMSGGFVTLSDVHRKAVNEWKTLVAQLNRGAPS